MKITLKKTTEEQVEITFPCYRKWSTFAYYKIINENLSIQVDDSSVGGYQISHHNHIPINAFIEESVEITAEDFTTAYNTVADKLAEITFKSI